MPTDEQVRDLLAAIRETLSPPWPADGSVAAYNALVTTRAAHITGTLKPTAEGTRPMDLALDASLIRQFAARPLPYEPEGGES